MADDSFKAFSIIPAPARAFLQDITGIGDESTYDKSFFHDSDLKIMKEMISEKIKENPKAVSGSIQYKDYPTKESGVYRKGGFDKVVDVFTDPEQRVKKTLGQFAWSKDTEGNIIIKDQFNFNDAPTEDMSLLDRLKTIKSDLDYENLSFVDNTYGALRKTAQMLGSPEGKGAKFNINLGKI